jgi:hypothetical protein
LTIDGTSTAVLGSSNDYTLDVGGTPVTLTGNNLSVTIPDTQTSVTLNMAALAEAIGFAEATDTLKLNLSTGTGYSIGSSNTASIAITQNGFIVTTISDMGEGSLRQAILNANAIAGADTITFGGSAFTDATPDIITLASGLTLTDNVTILGTGANQLTVAGAGTSSFDSFTVNSGVTASFDGLTVSNSRYGIFNSGTIANLSNSTFNGNSMGVYNTLGTIVSVSNSTFNGNSNGLYIADGTLTRIDSSTFSNHLSSAFYNQGTTASVSNSTFNGNNYGLFNNGTIALISNNTISGNRVGIFNNNFFGPSVTTTIVNNTIAGSTGQAILNSSTISNLYNNLLVGNADNSIGDTTNQGNNLSGTFADFNVDSILKNNGGSTLTHALLTGSAAANAGDNTQLPQDTLDRDGDSNTTEAIPFDQRGTGFDRVVGGIVDIGAFESNITPNAIPVVTVAATLLAYTENDPISLIDSTATVIDTDSTNFDTGTLTVNFSANGTVDDRLAIRNQGTSTGQVGVSGNSVSYEGTQIGIVTGGTGSTALVITFNTSATAAAVSALLQNLTYENVSEAPSSAARTVQFVVTDGAGGTSTAVTKTINVTAVDDTEFFVTNTNDSGSGSLRQAVLDANADAGAETITFIGSTFTDATPDIITLATGELGISSDVTLTGTGASLLTLSGNNASRVLNISRGVVSIDGVTIANGQTSETPTNGQFNALNVGGGVSNSGTLTLNNSLFTNNRAVFGGGLHNNGTLTINQSLFTQNHAYGGGGLSSDGTLTVNNSTFFNNITDDGAGIGTGGGIQLGRGTAVLTNVTLSGNQANGGRDDGGGGIMMYGGQLTVINSTIFGNSTTSTTGGGGISNIGAGSIQITLKNTIVAGNTSVASKPDVSGTVVSGGNNLIGANNGSTGFTNGTNGDLVGTIVTPINPLLAALAANGGLTQTHALLPGSTAINSGTSTGAPVTDQRGISRVGAVDIGAFESRGFTVALTGGNNQSTSISTTFTNPLTVNVSSAFNEPVAGGQITYKPNGLGSADASFASSSATVDSSGNASATTTANGTAGSYNVTAGGAGIATAASFSLTNTPPDALPTTLLWRNGTTGTAPTGTGENVVWQLNNFTLQSGYFIPTVADLNWQIISTADFDRDGHADILWRNRATGENVIWQMNSTGLQSGYFLTPVADANWRIIDTADFNGDGTPDLVWRHQVTGENAIWQMNGFSTQTSALLTAVADVNWQIVSTADFDNDGKADLLWRNRATGENAIWQMNGLTLKSGFFFTRVADTNWQVAGTADLNGDGIADLVWRNQVTGENALWQMNSTGLQTGSLITAVPDLNWQIAGVADLGGDSTPDLLWRNTATGLVGIWQLSSFSLVRAYPLPDVASEWNVRPFTIA